MPRLVDADWLHEKIAEAQTKLELDSMSNPKYWERVDKKYHKGLAWARKIINEAITIEINSFRPHGRWVYEPETLATRAGFRCSNCHGTLWLSPDVPSAFKHCPDCGAVMELKEEDDG